MNFSKTGLQSTPLIKRAYLFAEMHSSYRTAFYGILTPAAVNLQKNNAQQRLIVCALLIEASQTNSQKIRKEFGGNIADTLENINKAFSSAHDSDLLKSVLNEDTSRILMSCAISGIDFTLKNNLPKSEINEDDLRRNFGWARNLLQIKNQPLKDEFISKLEVVAQKYNLKISFLEAAKKDQIKPAFSQNKSTKPPRP